MKKIDVYSYKSPVVPKKGNRHQPELKEMPTKFPVEGYKQYRTKSAQIILPRQIQKKNSVTMLNKASRNQRSSEFVKQQLTDHIKRVNTANFANFEKKKAQAHITKIQENPELSHREYKPQWTVLKVESELSKIKQSIDDSLRPAVPVQGTESLQKRINKIMFPEKKRLLDEDPISQNMMRQKELNKQVSRASNYNLHRNVINGINKMIRPEQKVVTELKRKGIKSADNLAKTLKRLSLVVEDKDASLKANVNSDIVYDKLMLEYMKDQRKFERDKKNQIRLQDFQDKQIHKISCFTIPKQKNNPEQFPITNKSLRQLNNEFVEINPYHTQKKRKEIIKEKQKAQKHIYNDFYQENSKRIVQLQKEGNFDISDYILENDPVFSQEEAGKIILKAFAKKKKTKNDDDNSSEESEPYWYRMLKWEKQFEDLFTDTEDNNDGGDEKNQEKEQQNQQENNQNENNNQKNIIINNEQDLKVEEI